MLKRISPTGTAAGLALAGLAAVLALGLVPLPGPTSAAAASRARIEVGVSVPEGPWNAEGLDEYEAQAQKPPSMVMWFSDWSTPFGDGAARVAARGATPVITWEPHEYSLKQIAQGRADSYLRAWARDVKAYGAPVIIRLAPEMNADWLRWGNRPRQFKKAWRHTVKLFRAQGVTNVRWYWCPNAPFEGSTPLRKFYPGKRYVDIVGLDGYNWGTTQSWGQWQSFDKIFSKGLAQLPKGKPVIIGETGSAEAGGSKAAWISDFFEKIAARPRIEGFIWFNFDKETNWRIDSSVAAREAYARGVATPAFKGRR